MFKFELPCDWSINRRPNSSGGGTGASSSSTAIDSGSTVEACSSNGKSACESSSKISENPLPCGKSAKNKASVTEKPSNSVNSKAPVLLQNDRKEETKSSQPTLSTETKSSSTTADQSTKTKDEDSTDSSLATISGQVLGPRSNLKLDESFFPLESNSDHHQMSPTTDHNGDTQMKQPNKNGLPWSGQIKKLVIKHLQNASYLCDDDDDGEGAAAASHTQDGIRQSNIRSQETYLDTESLLSKLPYKKMLSDMFGGNLRGNLQTSIIPYVTRAYEEAFMHEPTNSSERECARGKQCECMFIDRLQPFVGVEFLLPGEQAPPTPHLCVLCCRSVTQQLYYDVIFDKCEFPGTIQRFGNIHSEPGEYSLDAMLIASPTAPVHIMPLPIVSHQRNRYTVYVSSGIKRLKQSRVHFHSTPSCSADNGQ